MSALIGTNQSSSVQGRRRSVARQGALVASLAALLVAGMSGSASAASDTDTTDAHVQVDSSIVLTGLTSEFTLTGIPGATVAGLSVVGFNVETNNFAGYNVTVQSQTPTMVGDLPSNTDSIPIGALKVRETGTTPYTAVSGTSPVTVHTQAMRSDEGGDDLSNDYSVAIPFVNQDTYTATLDYIAATL